jgi:uncharacterized glyoxalase superfamily protein PhnB
MNLSLDTVSLGVPQLDTARSFYSAALFTTAVTEPEIVGLDVHGAGRLALHRLDALAADVGTDPVTSGFRGNVLSVIVDQPSEVTALLDAATEHGATVIKPAKKVFFGGFTATYRAPDGAVWKLAAGARTDSRRVAVPPRPTETAIYLGVASPRATKAFYEELGMSADHDYGDKFIDFTVAPGGCRLGLLTRKSLAKDAGVDEHGQGFSAVVLTHRAASADEVDRLLAAAEAVGGTVTVAGARTGRGDYSGCFTDPDGHHWKATASA